MSSRCLLFEVLQRPFLSLSVSLLGQTLIVMSVTAENEDSLGLFVGENRSSILNTSVAHCRELIMNPTIFARILYFVVPRPL